VTTAGQRPEIQDTLCSKQVTPVRRHLVLLISNIGNFKPYDSLNAMLSLYAQLKCSVVISYSSYVVRDCSVDKDLVGSVESSST
jgi:hypothetical protein